MQIHPLSYHRHFFKLSPWLCLPLISLGKQNAQACLFYTTSQLQHHCQTWKSICFVFLPLFQRISQASSPFFCPEKPEIWSSLVARSLNVFKGVKPSLLHSIALVFNPEHKSVSEISETVWQLCCVGGKCKSRPLKLSVIADISRKWWMIRLKVLNSVLEISTTCNMSQFNNATNKEKATICLGARIH